MGENVTPEQLAKGWHLLEAVKSYSHKPADANWLNVLRDWEHWRDTNIEALIRSAMELNSIKGLGIQPPDASDAT